MKCINSVIGKTVHLVLAEAPVLAGIQDQVPLGSYRGNIGCPQKQLRRMLIAKICYREEVRDLMIVRAYLKRSVPPALLAPYLRVLRHFLH